MVLGLEPISTLYRISQIPEEQVDGLIEYFHSRTIIAPNGCWNWVGGFSGREGNKRPVINRAEVCVKAHRFSLAFLGSGLDESQYACHKCDNISCVNPDHLFAGTQDDNMKDMKSKGRQHRPVGCKNPRCMISEQKVTEIRLKYMATGWSAAKLAKYYGFSHRMLRGLLNKNWAHLYHLVGGKEEMHRQARSHRQSGNKWQDK